MVKPVPKIMKPCAYCGSSVDIASAFTYTKGPLNHNYLCDNCRQLASKLQKTTLPMSERRTAYLIRIVYDIHKEKYCPSFTHKKMLRQYYKPAVYQLSTFFTREYFGKDEFTDRLTSRASSLYEIGTIRTSLDKCACSSGPGPNCYKIMKYEIAHTELMSFMMFQLLEKNTPSKMHSHKKDGSFVKEIFGSD